MTSLTFGNSDLASNAVESEVLSNLIEGTESPDVLLGTPGDDFISGLGGDDTILGTAGSDFIDGGEGIDTLDFSSFSSKITLLTQGFFNNGSSSGSQINSIEEIIGAEGKANSINASSGTGGVSLDVNLEANTLVAENIPGLGSQTFGIENFVDVIGSVNADSIIGDGARNRLRGFKGDDLIAGNGGNDIINGNAGNDTLIGTDSLSRGVGERDVLRGGSEVDFFILGDELGSFYQNSDGRDRALIQDFTFGELIQLGSNETYNLQTDSSGFRVFLTTGSANDLIADVRVVTGSIPSAAQARSIVPIEPIDNLLNAVPEGEFTVSSGENIGGIFVVA